MSADTLKAKIQELLAKHDLPDPRAGRRVIDVVPRALALAIADAIFKHYAAQIPEGPNPMITEFQQGRHIGPSTQAKALKETSALLAETSRLLRKLVKNPRNYGTPI
jgi:hypothetical protein